MGKDRIDQIRAKIKAQSAKGAGGPRVNRMLWAKDGEKYKVRFLHELDDCKELVWYNSFKEGINVLGPENWGGEEDEEFFLKSMKKLKVKPSEQYLFLVWNYEEECVQILLTKAVPASFLSGMADWHDENGTLMDRNYILSRVGTGPGTAYSVRPEMKETPTPAKAIEAFAEFNFDSAIEVLKIVNKIPDDYVSEEELDRREAVRKEREEKAKEFNKKPSAKKEKEDKPERSKSSKNKKTPWENIDGDSEEDKKYFSRKEELDNYEDEEDEE